MTDLADPTPGTITGATRTYEVVALFPSIEGLYDAIGALESAGVDRAEMSLLAQDATPGGTPDSHAAAEDPSLRRQAPLTDTDVRQGRTMVTSIAATVAAFAASGITIATGGAALAAFAAAAAAGGGIGAIGATLGLAAGDDRDRFLREQIAQGGILLWVKAKDAPLEAKIREVLAAHGARNIHGHALGLEDTPPVEGSAIR